MADDKTDALVSNAVPVVLPSRGYAYGGKLPGGEVLIRPLTTMEEKLLMPGSGKPRDDVMYEVLARCILKPKSSEFPLDDYLVGDMLWLFLMLRAVTYGSAYTFEPSCKFCSAPMQVDLNLPEQLAVYTLEEGFEEPFQVRLPKCGSTVGLRLFRVRDEKDVALRGRTRKNQDGTDPAHSYRIAKHITDIDGETRETKELEKFIDSLHLLDIESIRDKIIETDAGVDLEMDRECPSCGRQNEVIMEITTNFFRSKPSVLRTRRRTLR